MVVITEAKKFPLFATIMDKTFPFPKKSLHFQSHARDPLRHPDLLAEHGAPSSAGSHPVRPREGREAKGKGKERCERGARRGEDQQEKMRKDAGDIIYRRPTRKNEERCR